MAELADCPRGPVHEGPGVAGPGGVHGRRAGPFVEFPVGHETGSRIEGWTGYHRTDVGHGHTDQGGGGDVAGGIAGDRREGVGAVGGSDGIPGDGIRGHGDFGAEVRAVEPELDADDSDVVGGRGRHGDGARDGGPGGRTGHRHRGGRGVRGRLKRRDHRRRRGERDAAGHRAGAAAAAPAREGRAGARRRGQHDGRSG